MCLQNWTQGLNINLAYPNSVTRVIKRFYRITIFTLNTMHNSSMHNSSFTVYFKQKPEDLIYGSIT